MSVLDKMLKVFPLSDQVLKNLVVLYPGKRHDVSPDTVCRLCEVFPQLQLNSEKVKEEFLDFLLLDDDELPREK